MIQANQFGTNQTYRGNGRQYSERGFTAQQGGAQGIGRGATWQYRGNLRTPPRSPRKPIEQDELEKAKKLALERGTREPWTRDCPIKCNHKVPYGAAEYCPDFRAKDLQMKQDLVKKMNMCRQCLSSPLRPHRTKDCRAPKCLKCTRDHKTLRFILPLPPPFRMVKKNFFKVTQNRF